MARPDAARIERIARWWNSASQEARYEAWGKAIQGDPGTPPLAELQLAVILAEAEAGQVEEG